MKAKQRRTEMANLLMSSKEPIAGGELARIYGVSRQIIVQDITILKASGYDILATHNGYILQKSPHAERAIRVCHTSEQTEDELMTIISGGGSIVDVFVWHSAYGKITASLNIFSPLQIKQFIESVRSGVSTELMNVTGGYHYHTVRAANEAVLDAIERALAEKGYLAPGKDM